MEPNLEKIRAFFTTDRFAAAAGIVIDEVREDYVECSMEITPGHLNAGGSVQGGAVFTLADLAFAVHANLELASGKGGGITVGQSCSISFLKSAGGKRLTAGSVRLSKGKNISVYRITVRDDQDTAVAEMIGNGFTITKKPDQVPG